MTKHCMEKKRVLIIGNGFDLDFGSDTRYSTFARSYLSEQSESDSNLLHYLKKKYEEIPNKDWFDFEKEIENYIKDKKAPSQESIDADKEDFNRLLGIGHSMDIIAWKTHREERSEYVNANLDKNPSLFPNPVQMWGRENSMANKILHLIAQYPTYFSKIISFNYTNFYEYLKVAIDDYVKHDDEKSYEILNMLSIIPIHIEPKDSGERTAVLGINDSVIVPSGYEFLKKGNQIEKSRRESAIQDIFKADELVIFGHSLGDSDADYFKPLFKDMFSENPSHERRITFITKGNNSGIWEQIRRYSGLINIMPKKCCTDIHFIDTAVMESVFEYESLLMDFRQ